MTIDRALRDAATALQPNLIALRRDLHAHPELAFEEYRTAALITDRLRHLGLRVETGIGGTGVIGVMDGTGPGRTILIRSDIDAVAQTEAPGRLYGSVVEGRNHSCGHDVTMTMVLGAAQLLVARQNSFAGRIVFLFQPADEPMTGAGQLIADGLWDRVQPDAILGLHVAPDIEAGQVVAHAGALWASTDVLTVRLSRQSGDIPAAAAQIASALYATVTSAGSVLQPVTFSITALEAKTQRGAPSEAAMDMRLMTFDNAFRQTLLSRIDALCRSLAAGFDTTIEIAHTTAIPAIVNDAAVAGVVAEAVQDQLGEAAVVRNHRHAVSDDFSLLLEQAPGCMVLFGTANTARGITAMWHTPEYDADEAVLHQGAEVMAAAALGLLQPS